MYIDVTSYLNSTMPEADTEASSSLDQDDFLQILVAQLEQQDPTEPTDNAQMVDQMTSYAQLEQLTNISTAMDTLIAGMASLGATQAAGYIGMGVEAGGYTVAKKGESISPMTYTLGSDAESVSAYIYDENGDIVDTVILGAAQAGSYEFQWDGLDYNGKEVPDGTYSVGFSAEAENGDSVSVSTSVTGTVESVFTQDGTIYLKLDDGRTVNLDYVTSITQGSQSDEDDQADA